MERYSKKSLCSFIDEEKKNTTQSPIHHHLSYKTIQEKTTSQYDHLAPATPHTPPRSPDSPWTLSPFQTPSPSLLHHCVTSLQRRDGGSIYSIAATRGGIVFTGSDARRIRAWRQPDCTEHGYIKAGSGEIRAMLAHGNTLFTAHADRRVRVWNVANYNSDVFRHNKVTTLPRKPSFLNFTAVANHQKKHKDCISCLAYYHAEGLLYTGSWDRNVNTWRVSDNRLVDSFLAHEDSVNAIVVNQDDGCVFTCSSDGTVKIWRRVAGQNPHTLTMTLKFQPSPVNALSLSTSAASCFLYSGSSDGFINFWEKEKITSRFNHGGFLQGHRFAVLCLVATEKLVFSGSEDTTIRVWRREEGNCFHECLAVLDAHRGPVRCLAAVLEVERAVMGFVVYSAGLDQTFKVWRVKVLPEEGVMVERGGEHLKRKIMEYEMSPVLSPSWVEKKLQGNHPLH
ncbi:protein JINGUBANG-like [Actinidia eriantha]|uniref:protein JINGUBANG-like n=1 Tax=Actinidia eriantha TaxID=165200 RepID=UPI002589F278|nr:protein JINGUBANG-like [Actinidia eriantha]